MTDRPSLEQLSAELPRDIAPPPGLWEDIRAELKPRASHAPRFTGWRLRHLIAAGLLIAAASSVLTLVATRGKAAAPGTVAAATDVVPAPPRAELPAMLANAENGYARSVESLQRTLDERRDSLAPSTIATVERSLRVADSAIAEARAALAQDPANRALAALFASNYERKIDLLRRATELQPRT